MESDTEKERLFVEKESTTSWFILRVNSERRAWNSSCHPRKAERIRHEKKNCLLIICAEIVHSVKLQYDNRSSRPKPELSRPKV